MNAPDIPATAGVSGETSSLPDLTKNVEGEILLHHADDTAQSWSGEFKVGGAFQVVGACVGSPDKLTIEVSERVGQTSGVSFGCSNGRVGLNGPDGYLHKPIPETEQSYRLKVSGPQGARWSILVSKRSASPSAPSTPLPASSASCAPPTCLHLDMTIPATPPPPVVAWPARSRGNLVRRALLTRFHGAKTMDQLPPEAAPFTNARIATIGQTQIGARPVDHPECRQWTQGVWSAAPLKNESHGVLGGAFLVDTTNGAFGGPMMSESIVYASAPALDQLAAAPPGQCATVRLTDGQNTWTDRYEQVALPRPAGAWGYRLRDPSGAYPVTWAALIRHGDYLIEVRLVARPFTADNPDAWASEQAMLADLASQAYARAASILG
ncbi:hypothetical protein GCM10023193_01370 [Planotetraspora kaengkrachanensis]